MPVRDPGSVTYSAGTESATTWDTEEVLAEFTQRVLREAARRRFTEAGRMVVLGDFAPFIWNIAQLSGRFEDFWERRSRKIE